MYMGILLFSLSCKTKSNLSLMDLVDHTEYIQSLIDNAYASNNKVVIIKKGVYYLSSVQVGPGLKLIGEDGVRFVKIENSPKFSRMINTYKNAYFHSDQSNSSPLIIQNITFNGNRINQGPYRRYQKEQQHFIFLSADRNKKGRLVAEIRDCSFEDGVADGIHVYTNVDVKILNCKATNVYRGGITVGGGNSRLHVENFYAGGDIHKTGINFEVDGLSKFGGKSIDVFMKNVELDGNFDLAISGTFYGDSITVNSYPFKIYAPSADVLIKNSFFVGLDGKNSTITYPKNVRFKNCQFTLDSKQSKLPTLITVINESSYKKSENNSVHFEDCDFLSRSKAKNQVAVRIKADNMIRNNILTIKNCTFSNAFKTAINLDSGGNLKIMDSKMLAEVSVSAKSVRNRNYKIEILRSDLLGPIHYTNSDQNVISMDKIYETKALNLGKVKTKILIN